MSSIAADIYILSVVIFHSHLLFHVFVIILNSWKLLEVYCGVKQKTKITKQKQKH